MSLKVSHVLINVDYLSTVLLNQSHEALNQLGEFRMLFLNSRLILLILAPYVSEKLLQVLRIIHDQLVDNCFVKIDTWKFIGVTFDDYCCHSSEVLGHDSTTLLHNEDVLSLYFLNESHICLDVFNKRLESDRDIERLFYLRRSDQTIFHFTLLILLLGACCCD